MSEIRHAFGKNGGNMAEAGAVSWMFHKKGDIVVPKTAAKEDDLMGIVLEAGAEDLRDDGDKLGRRAFRAVHLRSRARSSEEGRH